MGIQEDTELMECLASIGRYQEQRRRNSKRYRETHRQQILEYNKQWYADNPNYTKQYRETHVGELKELKRKWHTNNLEKCIKRGKQWVKGHPEKMKEVAIRHQNKRERNLGFEPLNKPFEGSEAHHLDSVYVVYIPKKVHESIYHCLETGENMKEIDSYAMNYILMTEDVK